MAAAKGESVKEPERGAVKQPERGAVKEPERGAVKVPEGEPEAALNGGLSDDEQAVWHAVKALGSTVVRRIGVDITAATGLSGTDYGVVSRLADLGGGRLGQQALTESMQLTKGAMSHQLTRMAERGLITRDKGPTGVTVVLTALGRDVLARARPVHAAAVQEHLIGRLTTEERLVLVRVAGRLAGDLRS